MTASAEAAGVAVDLAGVRKSFGGTMRPHPILAGLDLTVQTGELVAVAGRSGSGKTTLLAILAGWEPADDGSVAVLGADPNRCHPAWQDVAILPQSLGLLDELTVAENITLPLRLASPPDAVDPDVLMRELGVGHLAGRYPSETSLGEQQRTGLARAIVAGPRLLLADEPIAHQNAEWAATMASALRRLAGSGTACVLASHDRAALRAADRVLELHTGRLHPLTSV